VFAATAVGVVAVFLNMSGLAVALPTITRQSGANPGQAEWILLGYRDSFAVPRRSRRGKRI
jgi:hypothetical protein